jgi:hypothetical protein
MRKFRVGYPEKRNGLELGISQIQMQIVTSVPTCTVRIGITRHYLQDCIEISVLLVSGSHLVCLLAVQATLFRE